MELFFGGGDGGVLEPLVPLDLLLFMMYSNLVYVYLIYTWLTISLSICDVARLADSS